MKAMRLVARQRGFTIVEIMVALLLSLFLLGGILSVYLSSKQTYRTTEGLARIQESLRFSMDMLTQDIRMAGYMPCRFQDNRSNILAANDWWQGVFNSGVLGYEGGVGAALPAVGINPGDRVAGADAIAIFKGGEFEATVAVNGHNEAARSIQLQNPIPAGALQIGETAIICDAHQASLFQISNLTANTVFYSDTATNIAPGNCAAGQLGSTDYADCSGGVQSSHIFRDDPTKDAQLVRYSPVIYYIAMSNQTPGVPALKRDYYQARLIGGQETATMWAEELLQGVESMQIRYGLDNDGDSVANRYLNADDIPAADWVNVVAIQIGLLMATGDQVTNDIDTKTYNLAGVLIGTSGALTHPQDRQLRHVVNTTVRVRNNRS